MPRAVAAAPESGEAAAVEVVVVEEEEGEEEERWARLLPELLAEVVHRVEASGGERWPARKDVVSCACVCRRWRQVAGAVVQPLAESGKITFPSSLKQPGPREYPIQCFIKRNKKNSTFYLYLGLTNATVDKGKFLMAARRFRRGPHSEYLISLDADDLSQGSNAYVGKLSRLQVCSHNKFMASLQLSAEVPQQVLYQVGRNLKPALHCCRIHLRTFPLSDSSVLVIWTGDCDVRFAYVYDVFLHRGPDCASTVPFRSDFWGTNFKIYDSQPPYDGAKASSSRSSRRFGSRRISPQVSSGNFEVGQVAYKYNLLKSRGPRRMYCTLECPSPPETWENSLKTKSRRSMGTTVLRNKAPRWHEHLQCWCLNFHGRVTVASVKNFQLVAAADPSHPTSVGDEETVLLQFGKVDDDIFTMDYRQPLSAFQAFAISLSSFGTKLACE